MLKMYSLKSLKSSHPDIFNPKDINLKDKELKYHIDVFQEVLTHYLEAGYEQNKNLKKVPDWCVTFTEPVMEYFIEYFEIKTEADDIFLVDQFLTTPDFRRMITDLMLKVLSKYKIKIQNIKKYNENEVFFYSVIHPKCSCRALDGTPRRIGVLYREYWNLLKQNEDSIITVLNNLKDEDGNSITRMCCRSRFLSIPVVPMIDRSQNRMLNSVDPKNIKSHKTKFPEPKDPLTSNASEELDIIIDF